MSLIQLNGVSPDASRQRWRWFGATLGVVGVVLFLVLVAPMIAVRQVQSRIDAVTGTMTWKTVWIFGFTSGLRIDVSPLEMRLMRSGIPWKPSWQFLHNTHRNVFGGAVCYECGSAPEIFHTRSILKVFADAASDAEIREFVRIMQSGTKAEQEAAIEAAYQLGMETLSVERRSE